MGVEYQRFDGKEYVSLKRYNNLLCKCKTLEKENEKLKDDIKKWEDKRMRKLAEIYNMPTKYLTTAITKNEWYSSWYDTVKKKMLHDLGFDRLDVQDLLKENKKLKEKLSKREQGEYRYFGNDGEQDIYEITSIKDGPITYRKDSTGKWVADGEPPYVLC